MSDELIPGTPDAWPPAPPTHSETDAEWLRADAARLREDEGGLNSAGDYARAERLDGIADKLDTANRRAMQFVDSVGKAVAERDAAESRIAALEAMLREPFHVGTSADGATITLSADEGWQDRRSALLNRGDAEEAGDGR
ncbi:MAG: hypothetical protein AAFQ53_13080 [Bacteroidota bacterium]